MTIDKMSDHDRIGEIEAEFAEIEAKVDAAIEEERILKDYEDDGTGFFFFTDNTDWSENALLPRACVASSS